MIRNKYKVWIEKDGKMIIGKGRALLLEKIDKVGSLNRAAEKLNISYRAAWGKIKTTENNLGKKLVAMDPTGAKLTKEGKQWLTKYKKLEDTIREVI